VRPVLVVLLPPRLHYLLSFPYVGKQIPAQTLLPQLVVKALYVWVLPRATRGDVDRATLLLPEPLPHHLGHEFRPVVAPNVLGHPVGEEQPVPHRNHLIRRDRGVHRDVQTLPGVLIQHRQHP